MAALRLRRHALVPRLDASATPADVAEASCGIHAQVMSTTDLQVWARREGPAAGAAARALWEDRSLVRTWCMRGTLHLLTREQWALYAAVFDPSVNYAPVWLRAFEVTGEDLDALYAALGSALEPGEPLTRRELGEAVTTLVSPRLGARLGSSWGELLKPAARRGLFVNGPNRGQETTYVRTDRWLGAPLPSHAPDEARVEWLRRYLRAYGPATVQDYARWLGVRQIGPIRKAVAGLGSEATEVAVGDRRLLALKADLDELSRGADQQPEPCLRLLPAFDPFVLGHADRDHLLASPEHRPLVYRTAGWISPTILWGERIVGTWEHKPEGSTLAVRLSPFAPLTPAQLAGARSEAARLAAHFDREPALYT